ncbi:MAG: serine hydrolase [Spirosomataceae bacterium]
MIKIAALLTSVLFSAGSLAQVSVKAVGNHRSGETIADNDTCRMIDIYLTQLSVDKNFSGGLLIIKNGKKIFSKGYGWADKARAIPFTPATLASMGSITKAFTATAVMKLVEMGKLTLKDPLKKFFVTVPNDKATITIHQLLTHSSGFHEFLKEDKGDYEKIETAAFLNRAFAEPLAFTPGQKAVYTNVGMSLLAIIIEQVSGMDYEAFLKKNVLNPIGITNIGYHFPVSQPVTIARGYQNGKDWGTHPERFEEAGGGPYWNLKGNGGLEASLDDMFLWANAFTNHQVLSEQSIRQMFTGHVVEDGTNGQFLFGYGCNLSKSRRNTDVIGNGGSNGVYFARMLRLPEEGLVLYMVTNESTANANMVLPNVTQLYFQGTIAQDAMVQQKFETLLAEKIYGIMTKDKPTDLAQALQKAQILVEDDMILLEVGQKLMEEQKNEEAIALYQYYTKTFPQIVVAWNDLGDVYLRKDNKAEAGKCYRQALKLRPENARAKNSLKKLGE